MEVCYEVLPVDSGMEVQDVNRLIKQFREAQKMMKMLQKTGGKGLGKLFG